MPWYKVKIESVTRGHVFIEASDADTAIYIAENAPLEVAKKRQTLRTAIEEKVSVTVLDIVEQIEGQDYVK